MRELGNLPAAAQLTDHFNLHGQVPALDPRLVEASARERAAAHLRLPIGDSNVVLVDQLQTLQYAEEAMKRPPLVGGRGQAPGVSCVGLDMEASPMTNKATLLQVCRGFFVLLGAALTVVSVAMRLCHERRAVVRRKLQY